MCWWGAALVLGPNINAPMDEDAVAPAWEALQKATALAPKIGAWERAMIEALGKRYVADPPADRGPLDLAYADAMRGVAARFPEDPDAGTLFAEALMDLHPWNLYTRQGDPHPWTPEITGVLETTLARAPDHPGAMHLYIHATEASKTPGRAEPYADRLAGIVPGAGHLVHMPAHTYIRVGRYNDAVLANVAATKADDSYVTQCRAQGLYPLAYVPHNHHFLWAAACLSGQSAVALRAAVATDAKTDHEKMHQPGFGTLQHYSLTPIYSRVRFAKWQEILDTPAPPADLAYPTGIWHYARGLALAAAGRIDDAGTELAALRTSASADNLEKVTIWDINPASQIMKIAIEVLAGEIAARRGESIAAIGHFREGARLEDELNYNEPPDWHLPVRHYLGAALVDAGQTAEAEQVYLEDLRRNPENGWSLHGLMKSLQAQGRTGEAAAVEKRFQRAWQHADVLITASRF